MRCVDICAADVHNSAVRRLALSLRVVHSWPSQQLACSIPIIPYIRGGGGFAVCQLRVERVFRGKFHGALPPRALLFCPGDPWGVLPPRPASVGEQCWPPSWGAGEIGHEEAGRPPPAGCGPACASGAATLPADAGPSLGAAVPCPPWPRRTAAPTVPHTSGPERNERLAAVTGSPLQDAPCGHVALQQPEHKEQERWGSVKTVQPREGAPHST